MLDKMRQNAQSWAIKALFGIIIVVFIFFFGAGGLKEHGDPIMAYVNETPLTAVEFQRRYEDYRETLRRQGGVTAEDLQNPRLKHGILEMMVNERLVALTAKKLGLSVSEAEVRAGIAQSPMFQNPQGGFDPELYRRVLAHNRMLPAQYEEGFRSQMLVRKLQGLAGLPGLASEAEARSLFDWAREKIRIDYIFVALGEFMGKVAASDEEAQDFYAKNQARFQRPARIEIEQLIFSPAELAKQEKVSEEDARKYFEAHAEALAEVERVKARHILVPVAEDAPEADAARALEEIKAIRKEVAGGKRFAETAKARSKAPDATEGGDLGWIKRGGIIKPIEDAVFALKPGQVSEPVRSPFGWHILLAEERREAGSPTFEQAREGIVKALAEERASDRLTKLLEQSMDQLAQGVSIQAIAKGLSLATRKAGPFTLEGLQQEFGLTREAAETLFALPKGTSTKTPLAIEGGYLLAVKTEDHPAAVLPFAEVRQTIVEGLKKQKAMQLAGEEAGKIFKALTGEKTREQAAKQYQARIKTSKAFDRQGPIPDLGQNPRLLIDAFLAQDASWLAKPYLAGEGLVLARLAERIRPGEEQWQKEKNAWLSGTARQFREEILRAFLADLRAKAKVEVLRKDLLQ